MEAQQSGPCELIVIPKGGTEKDVVRRLIDSQVGPRPPPIPDPKPQPKPEPLAGVAWAVILEESAQRTPEIAAVLGDLKYWQGLKAKGIDWRVYDKDSPDAKSKGFLEFAAPVGLPALLLMDATGKVLRGVKLPATTAGVDAILGAK